MAELGLYGIDDSVLESYGKEGNIEKIFFE